MAPRALGRAELPLCPFSKKRDILRDANASGEMRIGLEITRQGQVGAAEHRRPTRASRAFTMIEIAICLAIVSFALIAIIGVLPQGLSTQKDNREETIINQDASVLIEAIRNGARGSDYLTNYVYFITNTSSATYPNFWDSTFLTNAANIVGLLSYPGGNHFVAYVHSISGLAAEKPPQDNTLMTDGTFSYRVVCVNVPVAVAGSGNFNKELTNNLHELRMTFMWPLYPNGSVGNNRKTFRATIAGQLSFDPTTLLYFYKPQAFTNAP